MTEAAFPSGFPNRSFGMRVSRGEHPFVVGSAIALGLVRSRAILDRAQSPRFPQRLFAHRSVSKEALIVTMAITPSVCVHVTIHGHTHCSLPRDWTWRTQIAASEYSPEVISHMPRVRASRGQSITEQPAMSPPYEVAGTETGPR